MNNRTVRSPLARMSSDLCLVINRVRRAYGSHSMHESAVGASVRQAEQYVDQTARQLLRGQADWSAWLRALSLYEACWMEELELHCRTERSRPAA